MVKIEISKFDLSAGDFLTEYSKIILITTKMKTVLDYKNKLPRRLHEEITYLCHSVFGDKQNSKKVVIFGQGRTGSTLLEDLLSSTSHFKKRGELLGGKGERIRHPFKYISGLAKRIAPDNFVFHLKIYQLTTQRKNKIEPSEFLKKLYDDNWKIIYLRRKNKLNHVLSIYVAENRGYHKFDNKKEEIKLNVDVKRIKGSIEAKIRNEKDELNTLKNLDFLEIIYEEDLENSVNHQNAVDKILDYLGLERRACKTLHKKVNQSTQKDLIENYEEVVNILNEKGWSEYIDS